MAKRIRRDERRIIVDNIEIADTIKNYCMDYFIDLYEDVSLSHVYSYKSRFDKYIRINFWCTADEWKHIMNRYNLVKSKDYAHTAGKEVWYEYELGPA